MKIKEIHYKTWPNYSIKREIFKKIFQHGSNNPDEWTYFQYNPSRFIKGKNTKVFVFFENNKIYKSVCFIKNHQELMKFRKECRKEIKNLK